MQKCKNTTQSHLSSSIHNFFDSKTDELQFSDMKYQFTLHQFHPNLIYQAKNILGGLKDIFIKQYPLQSTIFGPFYDIKLIIFVSKWKLGNLYVGRKLQIKTIPEFQAFQTYLYRKYRIPKMIGLLLTETFLQYINILSKFENKMLKKDPIFLKFIGVIGQLAHFSNKSNRNTHILNNQIYKNQSLYFQGQAVHHNQNHCFILLKKFFHFKLPQAYYLKLNSQSLILFIKNIRDQFQILQTVVLTYQIKVGFRMQSATQFYNIKISNGYNFIFIAFSNFLDLILFTISLNLCLEDSRYLQKNKYNSFSIQRENCLNKYYIDGERYFSDLFYCLKRAKREVCITDWFLTPYLLLKRPDDYENGESRVDKILFSLTEERKIDIYIIIYSEPVTQFHDSQHVQKYLQKNPRIHVIRHPDTILPILWSHHQKMVIIDEQIAFLGGLDIAYGRWDTSVHCIVDDGIYWEGRDYRNDRIKEVSSPRKYDIDDLDRQKHPRMPWHDIGIQIRGRSVIDLKRHFTQYWYFALKDLKQPSGFFVDQREYKLRDQLAKAQENQNKDAQYFTKQQQIQYYKETLNKSESQIQRRKAKQKTSKFRITIGTNLRKYYQLTIKGYYELQQAVLKKDLIPQQAYNVKHHLLRSSSKWSMGMQQNVQQSIHFGYIHLIKHAKQFVYIENQFFMGLQHKVIETLIERIDRAYHNKQNFKVIVVMPLLPGFPGEVFDNEAAVLKIQLHWQYQAIIRGQKSIFKKLSHIKDIWNYIGFFGLRNHGVIGKQQTPVSQIIYVHSKLMIVDDKYTLIGSANINDRSLLGSRDSEIAVITKDSNGHNIREFRCQLFNEHFGLSHREAIQFGQKQNRQRIWHKIHQRARTNTTIYRQIFGCYPDDCYLTFEDINKGLKKQINKQLYQSLKDKIKGHIVQNPLQFLSKQDLTFRKLQIYKLAPLKTFT